MKNRTYVFQHERTGEQIGVEVWSEGLIEAMFRASSSDIWSPKWRLVSEGGDPVQFAFETEDERDDEAMPCGCTDYHMADCPLITSRYDTPDPGDPYDDDFDPRAYDDEEDEEEPQARPETMREIGEHEAKISRDYIPSDELDDGDEPDDGTWGGSYCRHGTYIGTPGGADYMCGACEAGE